jgi:hypothetical protein
MHPRPDDLLVLFAGIALLVAGRRLFWLFVGVVGFLAGLRFALQVLGPRAELRWIVALAAGLLGVVLALALQRLAVAVAGFFVGGYAAAMLFGVNLNHLAAHPRPGALLVFVLAGIIAAILALRLFEGALIVLSSFAGAGLIGDALHLRPGTSGAVVLVLTVIGIAVQAGITARGVGGARERELRAR